MAVDESDRGSTALVPAAKQQNAAGEVQLRELALLDFIENTSMGLMVIGPDEKLVWANRAALELLGPVRDDVEGDFAEFDVDMRFCEGVLERLKSNQDVRDHEVSLRRKDGTIRRVLLDAHAQRNDGRFAHAWFSLREMTMSKQAEENFPETESRYQSLAEASSDVIVTIDENSTVLFINKAVEQIFGYRKEEMTGHRLTMLMPDVLRPRHLAALRKYLGTHQQTIRWSGTELTGLHKNGNELFLEVSFGEFMNKGRCFFTGIIRDIKERKLAHARLAVQYETARILATAPSLDSALPQILQEVCSRLGWEVGQVWLAERSGTILRHAFSWSKPDPKYDQFVAVSRDKGPPTMQGGASCSSKPVWVSDVLTEGHFARASAAKDAGLHSSLAFPIVLADQYLGVLEFLGHEVRPLDDNVLNLAMGIGSQIGQFIERLRAGEALRESEERFRLLVEGVKDYAIFLLDPEGLVVSWNSGAERTLGYSAGEILGKHFASFYAPEEIAADRPRLALEEAASKGQCVIEEAWRLRKGGVRFWAEVSTTALRGSEGGLRGFSKIIRDITERKQAEEELSSQMGEIARSNDELRQFAFCASHDLQEPLRKVETFGDRLKAKCGPLLTDEGRDYLERMQNAARRMKNLINHLLAYSRITTKAEPFVSVDLTKTTREVLSDLELLIEQSGARVELGDLPVIEADPTQMRQLLQNLLSNALKFQKPSEPPLVKVGGGILRGTKDSEEAPQGRLCQITVEDNGIGFEPENANRIFTLFARLHGQSKYDGNGIGLAICRKIVERHKGTIVAKSVLGQGATFVVTLPVAQHPEPREK